MRYACTECALDMTMVVWPELCMLYNPNLVVMWGFFIVVKTSTRASLVAQWLRIHLPMQGTRVRALVWEDPTCRGSTKPTHHNY